MKCCVPFCTRDAEEVLRLKYVEGEPEVALCSEHASKFRDIECYWSSIDWGSAARVYLLLGTSLTLLSEAMLSFAMGLNDASVVMARSSLEAALHSALSARDLKYSGGQLIAYEHSGEYDEHNLAQLIKEARRRGMLNDDLAKCAERVKEYGNFSAHVGERRWRQLKVKSDRSKLWADDGDAREALRCVVEIINSLADDLARRASAEP